MLQTSGQGWADSKAVHGMECSGVRSLYWRSLTAGTATWSVLYCLYTRVCSPKWPNTKEPWVLCSGGIYSWWHFTSPANGSGSHDCAPVVWAYGIPCPAMVSPNASPGKEDKLLHPDDYHMWCSKVDSGPRNAGHQEVGRCRTRGESEESITHRW